VNKLSVTVGITTCYGDESILDTVRSVRSSKGVKDFDFIIIADRVPISQEIKKELNKYKVRLFENKIESSQVKKQKQILKLCKTDLIIFTQDDVLFERRTLSNVINAFVRNPETTFVSVKNEPVNTTNFVESVINSGTNINNRIAQNWNEGDNYLSVIGRLLAFRSAWIKKSLFIPDDLVSSDAYFYFENKRKGGIYDFLSDTKIIFKNPQNIKEHLRKSSRFQHSKLEMSKFFTDISNEYAVPKIVALKSLTLELMSNPISTSFYLLMYIYTRFAKLKPSVILKSIWDVELSTKKVIAK
jgi:hypothetical protein